MDDNGRITIPETPDSGHITRRTSARTNKGQITSTPYYQETFNSPKRRPTRNQGGGEAGLAFMAELVTPEPYDIEEAMNSPDKTKWLAAMREELAELHRLGTWELPPSKMMLEDQQVLGSRWVFKVKADGRYRARLVAKGYNQQYGVHYFDVTAPVARHESLRTLLAIAAEWDLVITQVDVKAAFPNSPLDVPILMRLPGSEDNEKEVIVLLKKCLYGLKQSGRAWYQFLSEILQQAGFERCSADECVFIHQEGRIIILVYVDDLLVFSKTPHSITFLLDALREKVTITVSQGNDIQNSTLQSQRFRFLGMQLSITRTLGQPTQIRLDQEEYIDSILNRFGMQDSKPYSTPAVPKHRQIPRVTLDSNGIEIQAESVDKGVYQAAVGSLMYAMTCTRPDIAYAVSTVSQFASDPSTDHWIAVKRIFRYLKKTKSLGLVFKGISEDYEGTNSFLPVGYSDADWAGGYDRKSVGAFIFLLNGTAISWSSKKQDTVALSSTESEYMALTKAGKEAIWLRKLLHRILYNPLPGEVLDRFPSITINGDNQGSLALAHNHQYHPRTKHIDVQYHWIREKVTQPVKNSQNPPIELSYCPTNEMVADALTKALPAERMEYFTTQMGLKAVRPLQKQGEALHIEGKEEVEGMWYFDRGNGFWTWDSL